MSAKEETVEVTIKVPKRLMDLLEAENYLGFDKEYFFEAAIRGMIGCVVGEMDISDANKFYETYGHKVEVYYLPK